MKRAFSGALERNSAAISFIVLVSLVLIAIGTAYFALAINRAQFENMPAVKEYDNRVEDITRQDGWTRTKFYWSTNLGVASLYAVTAPAYLGLNSVLANSYTIGMALVFNSYRYGADVALAFAGQIFIHGILELTGIFIIAGASLRLAWKIWAVLGRMVNGKLGKITRRRRKAIYRYAVDYLLVFALGAFLIFLAAPIEAYVSPIMGFLFLGSPMLGIFFLAAVVFFYASMVRRGFAAMRRAIASALASLRMLSAGKWRPEQLSILMLALFSILMWLGLIF